MKKQRASIKNYYTACNKLKDEFLAEYFTYDGIDLSDGYWIGDEVGGVYAESDMFFDMPTMITLLENNVDQHEMFKWYNWDLDNRSKGGYMNLKNYLKSNLYMQKHDIPHVQ